MNRPEIDLSDEKEMMRVIAEARSISVWGFVTELLWSTFVIVFVLAIFGSVPWMSPIAPLVLACLSSASNPSYRIRKDAEGGNTPRK